MSPINPLSAPSVSRRYVARTMTFLGAYMALNLFAIFGAFDAIIGHPTGWALAVAVTLPIIAQLWATLRMLHNADEYLRAITTRVYILASGLMMCAATLWGFGEAYADAPHLDLWLVYPLFWACVGLIAPFVRSSR